MKNKTKQNYIFIFRKLKEHIDQFLEIRENYNIDIIHTDFEFAIGEACRNVYPNVQIKYCIWHMKRALEIKMNALCKEDADNNQNIYILYNICNQLYLFHPN